MRSRLRLPITFGLVVLGCVLIFWTCTVPVQEQPAVLGIPPVAVGGPSLKTLSEGAKAEGKLVLYWRKGAGDDWRQRFEAALNHQFAINVSIDATESDTPDADAARVIAATGKAPWDVMLMPETAYNSLYVAGKLGNYDWQNLFGVPQAAIVFGSGAFEFAHQVLAPVYNTRALASGQPPSSWDALLDPRWKGKLGISMTAGDWARLAQVWGDERTTQFLQKLATQNPRAFTSTEILSHLQSGDIQVAAMAPRDAAIAIQLKNGSVAPVEADPALVKAMVAGPLVAAPHPNAAVLFAGFLATEEGQQLWRTYTGESSIFVDGSPAAAYIATRTYGLLQQGFIDKQMPSLTAKYAKLLGI